MILFFLFFLLVLISIPFRQIRRSVRRDGGWWRWLMKPLE